MPAKHIPAKAGSRHPWKHREFRVVAWIPAFAGMTREASSYNSGRRIGDSPGLSDIQSRIPLPLREMARVAIPLLLSELHIGFGKFGAERMAQNLRTCKRPQRIQEVLRQPPRLR